MTIEETEIDRSDVVREWDDGANVEFLVKYDDKVNEVQAAESLQFEYVALLTNGWVYCAAPQSDHPNLIIEKGQLDENEYQTIALPPDAVSSIDSVEKA